MSTKELEIFKEKYTAYENKGAPSIRFKKFWRDHLGFRVGDKVMLVAILGKDGQKEIRIRLK